ncbi:MAG: outer membrane channel protein [Syntrophorhabdus sp. PtaB.Bin047]|jgi:outer membrane protein TolC|nr:MAG: outer membrane channel protein [Syntrophorhabdus sp. PtaB.Bin047]
MRRYLFCVLAVFLLTVGNGLFAQEAPIRPGEPLNLERAIDIGLKMNPAIMGYQYSMKAREAQLGQARAGYFPKVDGSAGFTRNFEVNNTRDPYYGALLDQYNQNVANVSLKQMIFDFWRTPTSVNIGRLNVESSRRDVDNSMNTVANTVKSSYYGVLKAKRSRDVNLEVVGQYAKHFRVAVVFFEAGKKPKYDVTKAELDLSNAKLNLIGAENDLKVAWVNLNNAMGIDGDAEYAIHDNLDFDRYEIALEDALKAAFETRPDLKSLEAQRESAEKAVARAKQEYYPQLNGNAQYNFAGSQYPLGQGWYAGVALSVNLFDGLSTTNKVAEAQANKQSVDAKISAMKLQITLDVKQAWLALIKARQTIETTNVQIRQATENLEIANLRYDAGLATPLEVTDATVTYSQAKLANISALFDYKVARANMEKAMGSR